jgi:hypothetical protein
VDIFSKVQNEWWYTYLTCSNTQHIVVSTVAIAAAHLLAGHPLCYHHGRHSLQVTSIPPAATTTRQYLAGNEVAVTSWLRPCLASCDPVTTRHAPGRDISAPVSSWGLTWGMVRHKGLAVPFTSLWPSTPPADWTALVCVTQTLGESSIERGVIFSEQSIMTWVVTSLATSGYYALRRKWCQRLI